MVQYRDLQIDLLWQKILADDEEAIEELLRRFDGAIRAKSRIKGEVNEDLVQDVRHDLYQAIKKIARKQMKGE